MPISDAQFEQWLKNSHQKRAVLAELDFVYQVVVDIDTGTPTTGTVYFANYPYVTKPADTPASTRYRNYIKSVPGLEQSINLETGTERFGGGQTDFSIDQLVLNNESGDLNFLFDLIVDGKECRLYLGSPTWARSDFRNIASALAHHVDAASSLNLISVHLQDRGLLLNTSLVGSVIGGTGPNAGRPRPIVGGFAKSVEAILLDSDALNYGVADDGNGEPITVYDAGFELKKDLPLLAALGATFTVDTAVDSIFHPDINPAVDDVLVVNFSTSTMGLTAGTAYFVVSNDVNTHAFKLSPTRMGSPVDLTAQFDAGDAVGFDRYPALDNLDNPRTITLAHPPYGRVTVDVSSPIYTDSRASDMMRYLSVDRSNLPSGNFSGPGDSFVEDDDACDFHQGFVVTDRVNASDLLDQVAFSFNGFWGFDRISDLFYGRLRLWDLGSLPLAMPLRVDDVKDLNALTLAHLQLTYKEIRGFFWKSWTNQTDGFSGGVPLDRLNYLTAGGLFSGTTAIASTRYEDNPGVFHSSMVTSPDYMTLISQAVCDDAYAEFQTWAEDKRLLLLPTLELISFPAKLSAYRLRLGDVVSLTLNRFGLNAGALFQVVRYKLDLTGATVGLGLLRRRVADFSTASYP